MAKLKIKKHNIDIMFLMVLFLVFTFSAVSVLLMSVNSYRSVVLANEANANARTATSYIRELVRQHDKEGAVGIDKFDGRDCIRCIDEAGYSLYIYEYDGYLMELEAKDGSGATADFGSKILAVNSIAFENIDPDTLRVTIEDAAGETEEVIIGVKSRKVLGYE